MRNFAKVLVPIVLLAISFAGASYLRATKPEVAPTPETEPVWNVRAATVERQDRQPMLDAYGELVSSREVTVRPRVAGAVIEASDRLLDGGRLAEGEVMLRIDPFDYQAAIDDLEAQIIEAKARLDELLANRATEEILLELDRDQLTLIARDVARYERLSNSSAASENALDDAKIALSRQNGTVSQREQAIIVLDTKLAQQEAVIDRLAVAARRAERDLADTAVKAPFAGVVSDVDAQLGKQLNVNDAIARLIDDRRLEIKFEIADADFGRLWQSGLIGQKIVGRWRARQGGVHLAGNDRAHPADHRSGKRRRDRLCERRRRSPGPIPLRPGAFIEVEMLDRLYEDVVELPASALFAENTVYVIDDNRLRPKAVELVATSGDQVLITTDIANGAMILTSRLAEVGPGLKVEVVD